MEESCGERGPAGQSVTVRTNGEQRDETNDARPPGGDDAVVRPRRQPGRRVQGETVEARRVVRGADERGVLCPGLLGAGMLCAELLWAGVLRAGLLWSELLRPRLLRSGVQ